MKISIHVSKWHFKWNGQWRGHRLEHGARGAGRDALKANATQSSHMCETWAKSS